MTRYLAQSAQYSQALEGVLWLGAVVTVVILATLIARIVWRRLNPTNRTDHPAFTFEDLRRLREMGDLTEPEYETLRRKLLSDMNG